MIKTELSLPELGLLVGTRGMLGMGVGLLLASRLTDERRKGAGGALAAVGVLSTIPRAWMVFHDRRRGGQVSRRARHQAGVSAAVDMERVKDVMSRDVKVISPEATLREAAQCMRDGDFGMLPVGEHDRMVGSISDRDIAVRAVAEGRDSSSKVRDVMSQGICWVYDDEPVERAAEVMGKHQVRRLPVVNREKRLVGIVALGDIATDPAEQKPAAEALSAISEPA
jgi:CBS domain-containing protein